VDCWCQVAEYRELSVDCVNDCVFVKLLGEAGLHQAAVQTLRTMLLSAQSQEHGGFVTATDSSPGT